MHVPDSFIKNVAIQLDSDYKLENSPFSITEDTTGGVPQERRFIGREGLKEKFLRYLADSKKGVYLVTGYRGMGKTSFVNHVLSEYNKSKTVDERKKIIPIHLTLTQNHPKEIDILKLIAISVFDKYKRFRSGDLGSKEESWRIDKRALRNHLLMQLLLGFLAFSAWQFGLPHFIRDWFKSETGELALWVKLLGWLTGVAGAFLYALILVLTIRNFLTITEEELKAKNKDSAYNRITWLVERSHALVTEVPQEQEEIPTPWGSTKVFNTLLKKTKEYPVATPKEIEYELQRFFELVKDDSKLEFIIIFDELDKVEPVVSNTYLDADMEMFEKTKPEHSPAIDLRNRKQAVINIISSLKNLFTTAEARFIFIAGNEMFDASLADIADRQSSISSIFTEIFNIESLLKEGSAANSQKVNLSLSFAIEEYLRDMLFGKQQQGSQPANDTFFKQAEKHYGADWSKIYFLLQDFVSYLTYRSNGSPKKLRRIIHEFVMVNKEPFNRDTTIVFNKGTDAGNYLYFNHHNRYRIGLINYLYRPYIIQNGSSFKLQSDSVILSTPYLFDHLLKFHPFAFSITNLELIPEVLSTAKTPYIKEHIREIIRHLGANHLRETDIGLFDFKFYSRTLNEISFLSKLFQNEAAAFNFTLDESYLVKLHLTNKIKELRSIYSRFLGNTSDQSQQVYSIAQLNGSLGDLYFFDQEYMDAIGSYSDAIRSIHNIDAGNMNMREFITLIKNRLKIGLCYEKTSAYDEALAFYSDSCQDVKHFMTYRLNHSQQLTGFDKISYTGVRQSPSPQPMPFVTSSLSDVLQIVIQCFLAKLIIEEKMGVEGITTPKVSIALGNFLNIAYRVGEICGNNDLIISNAFLLTGKLLFFKNSPSRTTSSASRYLDNYPINIKTYLNSIFKALDPVINPVGEIAKRKPALALYSYLTGLKIVMESRGAFDAHLKKPFSSTSITDHLEVLTRYINQGDENHTGFHYRYIATFLSNIGDCLLSMLTNNNGTAYDKYLIEDILPAIAFMEQHQQTNRAKRAEALELFLYKKPCCTTHSVLDIIWCYYISGQYFLKNGRSVGCSFQYRKILHLLRLVLKENQPGGFIAKRRALILLSNAIVVPTLDIIDQNSGFAEEHMMAKASELNIPKNISRNSISNHPETREVILLYSYIQIKVDNTLDIDRILTLISPTNSIGTQYSRVFELDFFASCTYKKLIKELSSLGRNPATDSIMNMVTDYTFSLLSIIRILKIYGTDYMMSYNYLAYTHYRLATILQKFSDHYLANGKPGSLLEQVEKALLLLHGAGSYASVRPIYHFDEAKSHYEKAYQLHTAGNEYKKAIGDMIYLEDDYNDNAYHFGAALDRYMMINGEFEQKINHCTNEIAKAKSQVRKEFIARQNSPAPIAQNNAGSQTQV